MVAINQYQRLSNIRRWQIHSGSNHFCCNGHCVTGRNLCAPSLLLGVISLTYLIWLLVEVPVLIREFHSSIILIVGFILIVYTYVYFFRSMCSDPGIISRATSLERSIMMYDRAQYQNARDSRTNLNDTIRINEILVECKYCVTCQMIRPPRASHCAICSNCVSVFDHHCPFLNNCIGLRNYRFFFWFLVSLMMTAIFLFTSSAIKIYLSVNDQQISHGLISSYIILLLTGSCALYTCNLLAYHCMITCQGLTTREDDKNIYPQQNPFDTHSFFENFARRLCISLSPSAYGAHRLLHSKTHRLIKETI